MVLANLMESFNSDTCGKAESVVDSVVVRSFVQNKRGCVLHQGEKREEHTGGYGRTRGGGQQLRRNSPPTAPPSPILTGGTKEQNMWPRNLWVETKLR